MGRAATYQTVLQSLMYPDAMWVDEDGEECGENDDGAKYEKGEKAMEESAAMELINAHRDILDNGVSMRSNDYYVADKIVEASKAK